jgi:DnaA family protein
VSGPEQLALRLRPRVGASFANFVVAAGNAAALHALHDWLERAEPGVFFLFGASGSGRSHLLQAACAGRSAMYVPLAELCLEAPEALFDGCEAVELVALDDIDSVLRDARWCEQLFHLFNRLVAARRQLLVSADRAAATLSCALPDLQSRLGSGGSFRLLPLDDADRRRALRLLADERGFALADDVLDYLFTRFSRDLGALIALLERLDKHSLAEQRRITIPFVRGLLDGETHEN